MKLLLTLALATTLTGALAVQADDQTDREMAVCQTELQAYYGEETELKLVDKRRHQHGTRMRVAVRLDADNAYFATCWVPWQEREGFAYADDRPRLASTYSVAESR